MNTLVKILLLEDNELDKKILQAVIAQSGLQAIIKMVDNEKDYINLLVDFCPDIVLADFVIPNFGGMEALQILKKCSPATPFIFVTGQISEDTAIECLKDGAWDYILKSHIKRLPIAIKGALILRDEKNEKEKANNEIQKSELRFRKMASNINDGILIFEDEILTFINQRAKFLLRHESSETKNLTIENFVPADKSNEFDLFKADKNPATAMNIEFEKYYPYKHDFNLCLLFKCTASKSNGNLQNFYCTISDVTHQRIDQREESHKLIFTSLLIEAHNLENLFEIISNSLDKYLNIKNFAIAILETETDMIKVVFLRDEKETPTYFPAGNTFAARVIKNQELIYLKDAEIQQMIDEKQIHYVGVRSKVWMGVPFETSRYKGLVAIQDYENENLISKNDVGLLKYITEQIGKQLERKFFVEDIKASEFKFRKLFVNMSSGAAILSPIDNGDDFLLKDMNNAARRIYKIAEKDFGDWKKRAFRDGISENVFKTIQNVFHTGVSQYLPLAEYKVTSLSYWLDFYIYKLTNGEIVIVFDNHSGRIKDQELIIENERRYRILSELTFEGILIHEKGIISDCNLSFARMFGYLPEELIGKNFIDSLIDENSRTLTTTNILNEITEPYEVIGVRKNGKRFPLEQEAKNTKIAGKMMRVVAMRDISQRQKAREEIRQSQEKFNKISNSANDAIILINHEGKVSFWNKAAAQIFQYSEEEVIGKNLHNLIAPAKYHPAHNEGFIKFLKTGEGNAIGKTIELEAIKKDGEIILIELSLSSINMNGQWNAVGILRDITVRKKHETEILAAKQQAEEMNRLKTNFLATMSHELRTPLNGILGFAEILKNNLNDPEMCDYAEIILKSSMRLLNTFNLIIDLSVIEANELKIRKKPEDLAQLLDLIQEPYKAEATDKGLYLDVFYKIRKANTSTDQTLFNQALNNLLNNAIKYTQVGGVTITLDETQKNGKPYFSVSVKDTGIGISARNISMIYDAFRQASEGYNRAFEGSGLGLHITKRYIDLLDGIIELESEPGIGSVFTIFIPKCADETTETINLTHLKNDKIETESPQNKLLSVLYVEDDHDHREFVKLFLKGLYEISTAINGPESIIMANEKQYDIILMDINLGARMNGLEAIKEIRKIVGYQNTPIAAVTANAMVAQKNEFLSEGCSHYISKPFNKKKLLEFMNSIIKG